jgi:acyl-CoA hydrolase/GNAT superfamily N-acetyltransferase
MTMATTTRWMRPEEAVRKIHSGTRILIGSGCAEPQALVRALCDQPTKPSDVEIVHLLTVGIADYTRPEFSSHFRHNAFFIGSNVRDAIRDGRADYTPIFLSEIPELLRSGRCALDAALVMLSPPDENGWCSMGIHVDIQRAAIDAARVVIAEINPHMPRTGGDSLVHLSQIDICVESNAPILEHPPRREPSEIEMRIGGHIASLVRNESCLQFGIGQIPDATCRYLTDKRRLGIHTEMFSDGLIELLESGAVDNSRKRLNRGKTVVSFVMGSRKLYDYVDRNPEIEFYGSDYVNRPSNIAQNDRVVAINSALQVDLTGQICSDSIGYRFYSGIGGQVDFIRGAAQSLNGRPIIALPSTAKDDSISRIVPHLDEGAGVVTSRGDAHYVVTEWGITYLHGTSIRKRALQLVEIAHPDFRADLLDVIRSKYYMDLSDSAWAQVNNRYPDELRFTIQVDQKKLNVRPLRTSDERALQEFFYSHGPDTIYHRYFYMKKKLGHAEASMLCSLDYNRRMALGAFEADAARPILHAVARYELNPRSNYAEPAIVVRESWQQQGVASQLLDRLREIAAERGILGFRSQVLPSNTAILNYHRNRDHQVEWDEENQVFKVEDQF